MEVARRIAAADVFDVVITGGEPLLVRNDMLCELLSFFSSNNIELTLNTNGRLLTPSTCAMLREQGVKNVLVSLHSWQDALHDQIVDTPGAASQTKAGIRNAIEQGLAVVVNQVVDRRNIDTAVASGMELEAVGVQSISMTRALSPLDSSYAVDAVDASSYLDAYILCSEQLKIPVSSLLPIPYCADPRVKDLRRNRSCSGGRSSAVVSCDGEVRFCPHDTQVWGNVLEDDLPEVWSRIAEWRATVTLPEECTACAFLPDCRGGCRVSAKLSGNGYSGRDPWTRSIEAKYRRRVLYAEFEPDEPHGVLANLRWRKEGECFLLYRDGSHFAVDADGLDLIRRLPERFVPSQVFTEPSHIAFLRDIYDQGLLVRLSGHV